MSKFSIPSLSSAFSTLFSRRAPSTTPSATASSSPVPPSKPARLATPCTTSSTPFSSTAALTPSTPSTPPSHADQLAKAAMQLRSMDPCSPETVYDDWQDSICTALRAAEAALCNSPAQEDARMDALHCAAMARSMQFVLQQKKAAAELKVLVTTPTGACLEMVMHAGSTVAALRVGVRAVITSRAGQDALYFNGLRLEDERTLGSYAMITGCRVHFLTFAPYE